MSAEQRATTVLFRDMDSAASLDALEAIAHADLVGFRTVEGRVRLIKSRYGDLSTVTMKRWTEMVEDYKVQRAMQICPAKLWHGNGHQSSTPCKHTGWHEVHEADYWHAPSGRKMTAQWRTGDYTSKMREKGIEYDPESYPETMGMTGLFDEPPQEDWA